MSEQNTLWLGYEPVLKDSSEALEQNRIRFDDALRSAGWLQPTAVFGVDGLGESAEAVIDGLNRAIHQAARDTVPRERLHRRRFPAVNGVPLLERTDYVASFPQLLGIVETFQGESREHRRLLSDLSQGSPWEEHLSPNGMSLNPAVCHPLYHSLSESVADGEVYDLVGECFRAEPSRDPMRLVAFRMHELVIAGSAQQCIDHRALWISRAAELLNSLGLDVEVVPANDPFFGRVGTMLANGQREAELKFELTAEVYPHHGTAIASGNCHETHFGENFAITTPDGQTAHTACFGFGLERIVLALAARHGIDLRGWPSDVRSILDLG